MPHRIIKQIDIANAMVSLVELPVTLPGGAFEVALFVNGSWEDRYMNRFPTEGEATDDFNRIVGILTVEAAREGGGKTARVSLR